MSTIKERAKKFLVEYYEKWGKQPFIGYRGLAIFAQAERDDMREQAALVVESHLDVNSDAIWDLTKEIRDLK